MIVLILILLLVITNWNSIIRTNLLIWQHTILNLISWPITCIINYCLIVSGVASSTIYNFIFFWLVFTFTRLCVLGNLRLILRWCSCDSIHFFVHFIKHKIQKLCSIVLLITKEKWHRCIYCFFKVWWINNTATSFLNWLICKYPLNQTSESFTYHLIFFIFF